MSKIYYVHKYTDAQGDHEVHTSDCSHLPKVENRDYLGMFDSCQAAVRKAKETYNQVDGCYYCCKPCHNH